MSAKMPALQTCKISLDKVRYMQHLFIHHKKISAELNIDVIVSYLKDIFAQTITINDRNNTIKIIKYKTKKKDLKASEM